MKRHFDQFVACQAAFPSSLVESGGAGVSPKQPSDKVRNSHPGSSHSKAASHETNRQLCLFPHAMPGLGNEPSGGVEPAVGRVLPCQSDEEKHTPVRTPAGTLH
jgi:hypothetical protein